MGQSESELSRLHRQPTPNLSPDLWQRLSIDDLIHGTAASAADMNPAQDVIQGLSTTPKTLPARYFYDDRGSDLFEAICKLPEYYPTRTERQILETCAADLVERVGPCDLVELGSGSASKTQILFRAYGDRQESVRYIPVDVSGGMLKQSAIALLNRYPHLTIHGLVGTYDAALTHLPDLQLQQRLIVFLGSSIGNLTQPECDRLFQQVANALHPGEYFLLGVDLQKAIPVLETAYNDAQGITAAFNRNMLRHLNWRFDGNFCLEQFEHWAFYNQQAHQIEMHLRSICEQSVTLDALDFSCRFAPGETVRTEISRKFNLEWVKKQFLQTAGTVHPDHRLIPVKIWTDPQQWFGLVLTQLQPILF